MKFIMAYSGGKDCTLALDRMIRQGHEPVALFTTISAEGFNFNHVIRKEVFQAYEECLGVPVVFCRASEIHHAEPIYKDLKGAIDKYKAEALCTGDIYLEHVASWNKRMAEDLGVEWSCPLWNEPTEKLLDEFLERGYKARIKAVETDRLGTEYLGKEITHELISEFKQKGIDVCGENGEYHTITVDGPIFKKPLPVIMSKTFRIQNHAINDVLLFQQWLRLIGETTREERKA